MLHRWSASDHVGSLFTISSRDQAAKHQLFLHRKPVTGLSLILLHEAFNPRYYLYWMEALPFAGE